MKLTSILLRFKKLPPRGKVDIGKYRNPIILKPGSITDAAQALNIEEKNMLYLRNPYLSFEESYGHATALGKHKAFIDKKHMQLLEKRRKPNVILEENLEQLRNLDVWD